MRFGPTWNSVLIPVREVHSPLASGQRTLLNFSRLTKGGRREGRTSPDPSTVGVDAAQKIERGFFGRIRFKTTAMPTSCGVKLPDALRLSYRLRFAQLLSGRERIRLVCQVVPESVFTRHRRKFLDSTQTTTSRARSEGARQPNRRAGVGNEFPAEMYISPDRQGDWRQ